MYRNMLTFLRFVLLIGGVLVSAGRAGGQVVDFEDLPLGADSYWDGSDHSSGFTSRGVHFSNTFTVTEYQGKEYESWTGWSYSNMTDTTTPGFANEFSAITGGGVYDSDNYAVHYDGYWDGAPPTVTGIPAGTLLGAYFTNTTYAYLSMRDGDPIDDGQSFAKQFEDGDWFKLMITGLDADGQQFGPVEFYLADYQGDDNYIIDDWTWVDLTSLDAATQLQFSFDSSDWLVSNGQPQYINTPAYFAMDNLTLIPEPTSLLTLLCGAVVAMLGFGRRRKRRTME